MTDWDICPRCHQPADIWVEDGGDVLRCDCGAVVPVEYGASPGEWRHAVPWYRSVPGALAVAIPTAFVGWQVLQVLT